MADFIESYVENEYFLQNPPKRSDDFVKYCNQLGLYIDQKALWEYVNATSLYPFLVLYSESDDEPAYIHWSMAPMIDIRPGLREQVGNGKLSSPLYEHPDSIAADVGMLFFSSFQILTVDCLMNTPNIDLQDAEKIVKLSIIAQNAYMPYFRSGGKHIQLHGEDRDWAQRRRAFSLEQALGAANTDLALIMDWYKRFVSWSEPLLGLDQKENGWLELWKNISWNKKETLSGDVRRGVEYLQWAVMLKTIIEDHVGHEILDIDEIANIGAQDILKFTKLDKVDNAGLLRTFRNRYFIDPDSGINYYHDKYKRLSYLAASFEIEYHPKVILFVEGYIEEKILPRLFERYHGLPGFFGIEVVNLKGVDNLRTTQRDAEKLQTLLKELNGIHHIKVAKDETTKDLKALIKKLKNVDIVLSNWESFINFNLERKQAIPFFLADNEGKLQELLSTSKIFKYLGEFRDMPQDWIYIWGEANGNKPWRGDSFELANFSNEEISTAIRELYGDEVKEAEIQLLRDNRQALTALVDQLNAQPSTVKRIKLDIVERLAANMFQLYEGKTTRVPSERPVFVVIDRILHIAALNHAPTTMIGEIDNRKAILEQITKGS